jgi:Tat protein secretion system quality control protein TatD with DNase activity
MNVLLQSVDPRGLAQSISHKVQKLLFREETLAESSSALQLRSKYQHLFHAMALHEEHKDFLCFSIRCFGCLRKIKNTPYQNKIYVLGKEA